MGIREDIISAIGSNPAKAEDLIRKSDLPGSEKAAYRKLAKTTAAGTKAKGKAAEASAGFMKGFKKALGPIADLVIEMDKFNISLGRSNLALAANQGQTDKVASALMNLAARNADIGMTAEKAIGHYNELTKTSLRLKKGFDKNSLTLTTQIGLWKQLGIHTDTSSKMITELDSTLGMSTPQIQRFGRTLQSFAVKTGQDVSTVFREAAGSMGNFMDILDTGEMTRQTLIFQARARAMGTSVQQLMGLLDKFETMDDAQQAGAKLNATLSALGGSFDAVKASTLDYPERMEMMASSIQKVLPRIRASGPRAQRLYLKSLRQSLGVPRSV